MTTTKRTGTCTEATFWKAVAELDWEGRSKDKRVYDTLKAEILANWDDEFTKSFDEILREKVGHLYGVITKYEDRNGVSCGCGDDGFSDLRHHIVGLGKKEFDAVVENPDLAVQRGQSYAYVESFGYCIPHLADKPDLTLEEAKAQIRAKHEERMEARRYWDEDEEELSDDELEMQAIRMTQGDRADTNPDYYAAWARRERTDIEALLNSQFADAVGRQDLTDLLEALTKVGEGDMFVQWVDMKKRVARVMKRREATLKDMKRQFEEQAQALCYGRHASMENLFGDGATHFGQ